jgi:hypothetical protein
MQTSSPVHECKLVMILDFRFTIECLAQSKQALEVAPNLKIVNHQSTINLSFSKDQEE